MARQAGENWAAAASASAQRSPTPGPSPSVAALENELDEMVLLPLATSAAPLPGCSISTNGNGNLNSQIAAGPGGIRAGGFDHQHRPYGAVSGFADVVMLTRVQSRGLVRFGKMWTAFLHRAVYYPEFEAAHECVWDELEAGRMLEEQSSAWLAVYFALLSVRIVLVSFPLDPLILGLLVCFDIVRP